MQRFEVAMEGIRWSDYGYPKDAVVTVEAEGLQEAIDRAKSTLVERYDKLIEWVEYVSVNGGKVWDG